MEIGQHEPGSLCTLSKPLTSLSLAGEVAYIKAKSHQVTWIWFIDKVDNSLDILYFHISLKRRPLRPIDSMQAHREIPAPINLLCILFSDIA